MTLPSQESSELSWGGHTYRARVDLDIVLIGNYRHSPDDAPPRVSESTRKILHLEVEGETAYDALRNMHNLVSVAKADAARNLDKDVQSDGLAD